MELGPIRVCDEFLHASFAGQEVNYLLMGGCHLHLPHVRVQVRQAPGRLAITSDVFARQIVLEAPGASGAVFQEHYFDLAPGQMRDVTIDDLAGSSKIIVGAYNGYPVSVRRHEPSGMGGVV